MGRLIVAVLISIIMSGCVILTTISGVAGAAVDGLFYMFQGEEQSFSMSMQSSLVSVQRGLKKSDLPVRVLEPVEEGYLVVFGNEKLDGQISLEKQTASLTTIVIKVKADGFRQDSIERALIVTIQEQSKRAKKSDRFDFANYRNIRNRPEIVSKRVGWYLSGKPLEVKSIKDSNWLSIKMPSGKRAYLKGKLDAFERK